MEDTNNTKAPIIFIIILILIIIGLGGYIAYDKLILNKKEETVTTKINDIEIDLNAMYQINNTLNQLDNTFNDMNSTYVGYIYSKKKIVTKGFDPKAAVFLALHDYLNPINLQQQLPSQQVKNNFETIFGQDLKYQAMSIDAGNYYKIIYDTTSDKYLYTLNPIVTVKPNGYTTYNIKTLLEDDNIVVTRKLFYKECDANMTVANIYVDASKAQLLGTVKLRNGVLNNKEVIEKYGSKMGTYEYTFKQNAADNYTLFSIEKIK